MNIEKFRRMIGGLEPWAEDFGHGMERRGKDGLSWYDLSINGNSLPCELDSAVILTSWHGQLKWLKATLESYRKTGAFVILAYDNPFYPWMASNEESVLRSLPRQWHYILANAVVTKHITYDADKRNGWFWSVRYAQGILSRFPNIKRIYLTNGDCILEKPEGFKDLLALVDDKDLVAGQSTDTTIHTADVVFRREAFDKIFDYMAECMRVPVLGSRSPEVLLAEAVKATGSKLGIVPEQPLDKDGTIDMYARYGQPSTWKKLVGFRNLFAEYETCGNEGRDVYWLKPYADLFMDCLYWGGEERETVCEYWKTGDRRHLYRWWDRWEDSWYNRLYYPLDHYGQEVILSS